MTSACPTGSILRARGARDSGTNRAVSTMAAMPTGRFTQKMPRQPTVSTSSPPTTGPRPMLMPTTADHTPIALARSPGSMKVFVMIDMATGLSIDPPIACSIRNATSQPRLGATLHSSEPRENATSPVWKVRRRPIRSAVDPDSMRKLARTRV